MQRLSRARHAVKNPAAEEEACQRCKPVLRRECIHKTYDPGDACRSASLGTQWGRVVGDPIYQGIVLRVPLSKMLEKHESAIPYTCVVQTLALDTPVARSSSGAPTDASTQFDLMLLLQN